MEYVVNARCGARCSRAPAGWPFRTCCEGRPVRKRSRVRPSGGLAQHIFELFQIFVHILVEGVAVRAQPVQTGQDLPAEGGVVRRKDPGYGDYCAQRDAETDFTGTLGGLLGTAEQFFAGITAESQYRSGDADAALETAFDSLGESFDTADAVTYVAGAAIEADDASFCGQILSRLDGLSADGNAFDEDMHEDLKEFKDMLREAA